MPTGRSRTYDTEGVILRRRNMGEADSILTVFSPTDGKFDAIARGVRKPKSRMRGHLEPLTRSKLHLAQGRNLDVFAQAETIAAYRTIRDDLDRLTLAVYFAELIDRFTTDRDPQASLYALLLSALEALDAGAPLTVGRYFELQILALTGYELQLVSCAVCGSRIPEAETLFSANAGGLVCDTCRPSAGYGRMLDVRAMKVLRFAASSTIGQFAGLKLDEELESQVRRSLDDSIRHVLERETNSRRYVDALAAPLRAAAPVSAGDVQSLEPLET